MSLISVNNLTFAYDGSYDNIFSGVSFQLDTNWKLGFLGRNGRGKTTFLKLLLGEYEYKGSIKASVSFEYFPFPVSDKTLLTAYVIDSIYDGYEPWELARELNQIGVAEDSLYRPFETLSNGEQTKVLLVALFLKPNSFLLIDEPTNHLDIAARAIVSDYLNRKNGYILVSHDRSFVDGCVDHVLSINKQDIDVQRGNFTSWHQNKQMRDNFELAENEKLAHEVKKLSAAAKRTATWSDAVEKTKYNTTNSGVSVDRGYIGAKSAKMMARSKAIDTRRQKALDEKSKLLKNLDKAEVLKLTPLKHFADRLVEAIDLSIYYGDKLICKDISFTVEQAERVALSGKNGSGKSSILKLILGQPVKSGGVLRLASGLVISYLPQDTSHLYGNLRDFAAQSNIDESRFMTILRKLDFERTQFEKDIADYSGGQKKKVLIAKSLCETAHLYIWDEPLNFIDALSRIQIEQLLLEFRPTMLFVEHDLSFCSNVATKTVDI